jgi:hypothetical protein
MRLAKKAARQLGSLIKIIMCPAAFRYPAIGDDKINL